MRRALAAGCLIVVLTAVGDAHSPVTAQENVMDCAHGPDSYRVRGVAATDRLNIRSGPGATYPVHGSIPPDGSGVICEGPCEGRWCRVSWRGVHGWTNMRYLGE